MPDVMGLSIWDAVRLIEESGLQVEIQGDKDTVVSQYPAPDIEISINSIVMIETY